MKKKLKVYTEAVKDRHTSHWDLDLLSRAELEKHMDVKNQSEPDADREKAGSKPQNKT